MAQYRGTIQGNRGETSRLGTKSSGLVSFINGWNAGIKVRAFYDKETNEACFIVWSTGGSNPMQSNKLLGVLTPISGEYTFQTGRYEE